MLKWLSQPSGAPLTARGARGTPSELEIERRLQEDLLSSADRGDWKGLRDQLRALESRVSVLGAGAVASIVNVRHKGDGPTLLHLVCGREGSKELSAILLRLGADPNSSSYLQEAPGSLVMPTYASPIFWAISQGDVGVVKLLLKNGADINFRNKFGETPFMFLTTTAPPLGRWWDFRAILLKAGADVAAVTHDGRSPLSHHLLYGHWEHAQELVERGATLKECSRSTTRAVVKRLRQFATEVSEEGESNPRHFKVFIDILEKIAPALSWEDLFVVLNHGREQQPGFFGKMLLGGCSPILMERAVRLGGAVAHVCELDLKSQTLQNVLPLHLAILSGNVELVERILRRWGGSDLGKLVGPRKLNALHLLYVGEKGPNHELSRLFLEWGVDPYHRDADGASLLDRAVAQKDVSGIHLWTEYESNPFALAKGSLVREVGSNDPEVQAKKRGILQVAQVRASLPRTVEGELAMYAGEQLPYGFSARSLEYLDLYRVAAQPEVWGTNHSELYKILPRVLFAPKVPPIVEVVRAIDRLYDREVPPGYHPLEADLMVALARPDRSPDRSELARAVVLALTSINRFLLAHIEGVPGSTVAMWGRIGVLGFSFRAWKWDTRGVAAGENRIESLFEQFGFSRAEAGDEPSAVFGEVFTLSQERKERIRKLELARETHGVYDPRTHVEFRHGCIIASPPTHGTLVIRNSSPIFGRDLLSHPAYFSRLSVGNGLPDDFLATITPRIVEGALLPVLHSSNYSSQHNATPEIEFLVSQLEEVRTSYAAWKFDADHRSAWDRIEGVGTLLRGGYYSEGFSALTRHLRRLAVATREEARPAPALAFFPRHLPPWVSLPFTDLDGKELSTLQLDERTLSLLERLATSEANGEDFRRDNGRAFEFFQKGLDAGAELIIVDQREEKHDSNGR